VSLEREFFARVLRWPEPDETFWCNLHPQYEKIFGGRAYRTLDDFMFNARWMSTNAHTKGLFFCLSSQAESVRNEKGYMHGIRSQANAVWLKALWFDLDAGQGKPYADVTAAVTALGRFCVDTGLPRPQYLVGSGGGCHAYWIFDRAVQPHEWQPLADALAQAAREKGLHADLGVTVDCARVLRVPGSFNNKTGHPRPVKFLIPPKEGDYAVEFLSGILGPFKDKTVAVLPPRAPIVGVSDLAAGIEKRESDPIVLDEVAGECPFVRDAITSGGKDFTNPLWNLTTLLATFTTDPEKDAHRMACGHPGYTKESTDELLERKKREADGRLGWPRCKTIAGDYAGCKTCPHFDPNGTKTPVHFSKKPAHSPAPSLVGFQTNTTKNAPLLNLPPGYTIKDDQLKQMTVDPSGAPQFLEVLPQPIWGGWVQEKPFVLHFTTKTRAGGERSIGVPFDAISSKDTLLKVLSGQAGIVVQEAKGKFVKDFFVAWIQDLMNAKDQIASAQSFGWADDSGQVEGFVYGGRTWGPNGDKPAACTDPVLARRYTPKGDRSHWIDACAMVTAQERPDMNAIIASAFAAPLVYLSGQTGVMLSAYSAGSGIGKTTALKIAQAVWGSAGAHLGVGDTILSATARMGQLRSLPVYWDEIKTADDMDKFAALFFQLTRGQEKNRLRADTSFREGGSWKTLMASCSNESLLDVVAAKSKTPGIYRIFEFECTPRTKGMIEISDADRMLARLDTSYGQIGLEYAQWLGQNHAQAYEDIGEMRKQIDRLVAVDQGERFWTSLIACVVLGAKYANDLGFTNFNVPQLQEFMLTQLGNMRSEIKRQPVDMDNSMHVSNALAEFLGQARSRNTITTNRIHVGKGKPAAGSIVMVNVPTNLDAVHVHIGRDDHLLRISKNALTTWMRRRNANSSALMRALERRFSARTNIVGIMGSGTPYSTGMKEYIVEMDTTGTELSKYLEETV
jgi:hypothetical protein